MTRFRGLSFAMLTLLAVGVPTATQAQDLTFTGVVTGPDDQPLPAARVIVFDTHVMQPWWPPVEGLTDAAGKFALTVPPFTRPDEPRFEVRRKLPVLALKDGLALAWTWAAPGDAIALQLSADPITRSGRVVKLDGEPITGADVAVRALSLRRPGESTHLPLYGNSLQFLSAVTDDQGRFAFGGLPREVSLSLVVSGPGYARLQVSADTEEAGEIVVTLPPEATVSGRVTHDGQAVAGVRVFCQGHDFSPTSTGYDHQVTAADGTYTLRHLPPGTYNVLIDPPASLAGKALEGLTLATGAQATGADFALNPGAVVRGRVTNEETGQPVPDVLLAAYGPARPQSSGACQNTRATADGTYELRLPPGKSMVYYMGSGGYVDTGERERWLELTEGQTLEGVDFVLRPPDMITGQVLDEQGDPAPQAEVHVFSQYGLPGMGLEVSPEGKFELINPFTPEAEQGLSLLAIDWTGRLATFAIVAPGQETVTLRLQPAAYLLASATDADGTPAPGIQFTIKFPADWFCPIAEGHTDEAGLARIGPLPAGVTLEVSRSKEALDLATDPGWWNNVGTLTLEPGEERTLPPLVLKLDGRVVRLCVLDEEQHPVPGALVFARGRREGAATNEHGQLELHGMPMRGKIALLAMHPTLPLFATYEVDPDWEFWPGLILKPLCRVKGRIQDGDGKPVRGMFLSFSDDMIYHWIRGDSTLAQRLRAAGMQAESHGGVRGVTTDETGAWEAGGFIEGASYDIMAPGPEPNSFRTVAAFTAQPGPDRQDLGTITLTGPPPAPQ